MQNHEIRQKLRETNFAGLETVKIVLKSGDIVDIEDIVFSHLDGGMIQIIAGPTEDELEEKEKAEEQSEAEFLEKAEKADEKKGYRLGCEDDNGQPVHPNCVDIGAMCGCGQG